MISETCDIEMPLFSVVIPLEFHRDRWEKCVRAWQAQSISASEYELLLVTPPGFSERNRLAKVLAETDMVCRVLESNITHDIGLCAFGAEHARGQYLFFTESHCWPEPDVLALCVQAFDEHHSWAGLSCRSLPVTSNRLGEAEAEMYGADIEEGMTVHPWRKILDQCFVAERHAYMECGGFKSEYGHFAEWALAANYHALGLFLGYLPEARFSHQYVGKLNDLRHFTRDFVRGEIKYLSDAASEPGSYLIEVPEEWMTQGNLQASPARTLFKRALRHGRPRTAMRWLSAAIFGDQLRRARSSVAVIAGYVRVAVALRLRSDQTLKKSFTRYTAALVHHQRLSSIAVARKKGGGSDRSGFYPTESFEDTQFRWSEPAAIIRIDLPAGRATIVVDCLPFVAIPTFRDLHLQLGRQAVADADVLIEPHRIVITAHSDETHPSTLSWVCSRVDAPNDPRVLGLPVGSVEIVQEYGSWFGSA